MNHAFALYATLVIASACLQAAGVFLLWGLGWALISGGLVLLAISEVVRRGMNHVGSEAPDDDVASPGGAARG